MSIALRVLPSRLELKRRDGSGMLAPRANVSFTTFVYVSPVQTIPSCDQTGTPAIAFDGFLHFRSSIISGSASRISARMRARVSSRQSPRSRIRWSMSREADFPGLAFAPAFGGDFDLVADLRGLLARDVPLALGLLSVIIRHSPFFCQMFLKLLQVFIPEAFMVLHPVLYSTRPTACGGGILSHYASEFQLPA